MKRNKSIRKALLLLTLPILGVSCDDEENTGVSSDWATLSSSYYEADGSGILTIPFRNPNPSFVGALEVKFGGTAVEGEDFEYVGTSAEGIQIRVLDDNNFEPNETLRIEISPTNGNNIHTVTIVSECDDTDNPYLKYFSGTWDATEKYGPDPSDWASVYQTELVQDEEDPTKFYLDNFYGVEREAYLVFDVAAGTVRFPDQQPLPDPDAPTLLTGSSGTFVIDPCNNVATLTITLNYDGGVWEYSLVKH